MKLKTNYYLFLFFLFGIVLNSCNSDDKITPKDIVSLKKQNVKHISTAELFKDSNFKNSLAKIPTKTKANSFKTNKTIMEHEYGFTIEEFKPANVFETDSIISYTLLITRPNQNDQSVENLVINTNKFTGNISALIIKYVSDSQITNFSNFNGERTITPIVYNSNQYQNSTTGRLYYDCITVTYYVCANASPEHIPGQPGCAALPNTTTTCGWFDTGSGGAGGNSTGGDTSGTSNGGGGGGTITSPVYTLSPLELAQKNFTKNLSDEQRTWLDDNIDAAKEIYTYLAYSDANTGELEYSNDKVLFVEQLIDYNISNPQPNFNINNYPGNSDNMPFEWWKDSDYIKNNLKIASHVNPSGETPNPREVLLYALFPAQAIIHIKNSYIALDTSKELVNNGTYTHIHNGKADAFRHAFWNAYDTTQIGSFVTKAFTDAHEWNSGNHPMETQMDIHNNQIGRDIGSLIGPAATSTYVKNEVIIAIHNGQLKYISPLGINGDILINSIIKNTNE